MFLYVRINKYKDGDSMERKEALVHFSGGLDSLLATIKTIEEGYRAVLINYNNGAMGSLGYVNIGYERLKERYGSDLLRLWGYGLTVGYFKALRDEFYQMTTKELALLVPHLSMGQINCLTCRSAMYIFSVLVCQREKINVVVDGARRSQGFVLERDLMIKRYKDFFNSYGISFLTPVLDLESDYERELAILLRGISPIPTDDKCFLGVPITFEDEDIMQRRDNEAVNIWDNNLKPKCYKLVDYSQKMLLDNRGKLI